MNCISLAWHVDAGAIKNSGFVWAGPVRLQFLHNEKKKDRKSVERIDWEETLRKESDYIGQVSFYSYWLSALWAARLGLQAAWRIRDRRRLKASASCRKQRHRLLVKCLLKFTQITRRNKLFSHLCLVLSLPAGRFVFNCQGFESNYCSSTVWGTCLLQYFHYCTTFQRDILYFLPHSGLTAVVTVQWIFYVISWEGVRDTGRRWLGGFTVERVNL